MLDVFMGTTATLLLIQSPGLQVLNKTKRETHGCYHYDLGGGCWRFEELVPFQMPSNGGILLWSSISSTNCIYASPATIGAPLDRLWKGEGEEERRRKYYYNVLYLYCWWWGQKRSEREQQKKWKEHLHYTYICYICLKSLCLVSPPEGRNYSGMTQNPMRGLDVVFRHL